MFFDPLQTQLQSLNESVASKQIFGDSVALDYLSAIDEVDVIKAIYGHSGLDGSAGSFSEAVFDDVKGFYDCFLAYDGFWLQSHIINVLFKDISHCIQYIIMKSY
jgi:hypothetical protein